MRPLRIHWGIALLLTLACGLRLATVLVLAGERSLPVTFEHGEIAENLLAGRGFAVTFLGAEGSTSQQAPLYPALLALFYRIWGIGPGAILAMQLLQCLAGTLLVWCVLQLGWNVVPAQRGVGWCAAIVAAVYPTHLYMVTHIQVASWAALLLVALCLAVVACSLHRSVYNAAWLGLLGGLLLLVEPILSLTLPVLALWDYLIERRLRNSSHWIVFPAVARVGLFAGVTLLAIAPWLWRNHRVHGELVFIKSTFGYAFWQGNNAASWGTDKIPKPAASELLGQHNGRWADVDRAQWAARHKTLYIDDVLLKPTGYVEFANLSEPARARLLGARAAEFVRAQPARYARLCLQRLRYFLLFDETNPKTAHPLYRSSTVVWLVITFIGLLLARRQAPLSWPLLAIVVLVALFHVLTITSARFRIPLEPLTFVWTALPLALPLVHFRRLRRPAEPAAGANSPRSHVWHGPHHPRRYRSADQATDRAWR